MKNNFVALCGTVANEPKNIAFEDGGMMTVFNLKTVDAYEQNGQQKNIVAFHHVVCRGGTAEIAKFLSVGKNICVRGALRSRTYEKDGQTVYVYEVQASYIEKAKNGQNKSAA